MRKFAGARVRVAVSERGARLGSKAAADMIAMREDARSTPTPMPARLSGGLSRQTSRGGLSRQASRGGLSRQASRGSLSSHTSSPSLSRQPSQSELTDTTLSSQHASVFLLNGLDPVPLFEVRPMTVSFGSPVRRIYSAASLETTASRASSSHSVSRSQSMGRLSPMSATPSGASLRAATPGARPVQRATTPFGYGTYRRRSLLEEKIIGVRQLPAPTPRNRRPAASDPSPRVAGDATAAGRQQSAPGALLNGAALALWRHVAGAGDEARGALADHFRRRPCQRRMAAQAGAEGG